MKLKRDIRPITYMKTNSADLIEEVNQSRSPVVITQNGEARAVIQDLESYDKQRELLALFQILAQGEREIKTGRIIPQKEVFAHLDKRFASLGRSK
jgi:prevent-host-death family protein